MIEDQATESHGEHDAEEASEQGVLCLTITPYRVKILT